MGKRIGRIFSSSKITTKIRVLNNDWLNEDLPLLKENKVHPDYNSTNLVLSGKTYKERKKYLKILIPSK